MVVLHLSHTQRPVFLMRTKILIFAGCLLLGSTIALAQSSGGSYAITKSTIDNGGGASSGGPYSLTGTVGQPDASLQVASGGQYAAAGGFWANALSSISDLMFKNGFESS